MRTFTLLLALSALFATATAQAQTLDTKGNGQVFFSETFGWENPADAKGWTAPAGFYFLDPKDLGYNWTWWKGPFVDKLTQDPMLQSTTKDNGCIALFLERYNLGGTFDIRVDNSVVFPKINCSSHSSVVVRYETHFMGSSPVDMFLEISVDNWVHSASYSVNFGAGHKDRPLDRPKGVPAIMEVNISDVAAGMSDVQMRLHWVNSALYYWAVDDFTLSEAYDNDLKISYVQMEWEDGNPNTTMAWIHNIPKSQLDGNNGFTNFQTTVLNFGEYDQEEVYLDLDITKNGNSVFHRMSLKKDLSVLVLDTVDISDKYSPTDYGHYKVAMDSRSKFEDQNPADNKRDVFFNVTDSIYSRSDDTNDLSWSFSKERYDAAAVANVGHFNGSVFPIFNDCEVSSISTYIAGGKADEFINYRFTLYFVPIGQTDETPYELLTTEMIQLDSTDFNTWVTMPLDKDGESEFLKKGDLVYAGITYDNLNPEYLVRRNKGLEIGTDNSVKLTESSAIAFYDGNWETGLGDFIGKRNLMIRLNLNDHGNISDGVDLNPGLASLGQNFPNPFSHSTNIDYELTGGSEVTFEIMDLTGRKVLEVNNGWMPAGKQTFILETYDLEAGVYFYTLKAGSFVQTKQMVITK
ncbi:MAG: T9SS C-terminal target domain-containing protein [Porphyromonadaceae bacterium]|nr:MAG: T9SS C-terminal target domain-containing protein [Porphyromonadaceae bacterium]